MRSFTLQAWINPDRIDANNVPIITKSGGRNYTYALGMDNGDQIWLQFSDANNNNIVYTTYGVAPGNTWTQVTGVVDGVAHTMTIYINGVQAAQQSFNAYTPVDSGSPLVIAADQPMGSFGDGAFQGLIQQVAVWNVARAASDIAGELQRRTDGDRKRPRAVPAAARCQRQHDSRRQGPECRSPPA